VAFTYPHIGNYGVALEDREGDHPYCRAVVARSLPVRPSNWRSEIDLESYLTQHNLACIIGVDTRRLTRHLRKTGSLTCAIGRGQEASLLRAAKDEPGTLLQDLVKEVSISEKYLYKSTKHGLEQASYRDGGRSVSDAAMQDAVSNPVQVVPQADGSYKYIGQNAVVVLNSDGKVITTYATHTADVRVVMP